MRLKFLTNCFIVGFVGITNLLFAGTLILEGRYQSKNIFVINQTCELGVGFNIYEVRVNGMITTDEINNYAFEIDLAQFNFGIGEYLIIEIKFKNKVPPKILNPYALRPLPTFEVSNIFLSDKNILHWETSEENEEMEFFVQQFKWNKWVNVGKVSGRGGKKSNNYVFQTSLVSGYNNFRVAQIGHNEVIRASPEVRKFQESLNINFTILDSEKKIVFTQNTSYEIHDKLVNLRKRGFGNMVKISNLKPGSYYLSFDNQTKILILK